MKTVLRILKFNTDFRILSSKDKYAKILEVNVDNLSRYNGAQNVGVYPRRLQYEDIQKKASSSGASLFVLYNTSFIKDANKAKRWGINFKEELNQTHFFAANEEGIAALSLKLTQSTTPTWVLMRCVYIMSNLGSYIESDSNMQNPRTQQALQGLLANKQKNIVFIGIDKVLNTVSCDKFLTTRLIPAAYSPKSELIINGMVADSNEAYIRHKFKSDVVFKPLSQVRGVGIHKSSQEELKEFFINLSRASERAEALRLTMNLNVSNTEHYWLATQSDDPFIQCQDFAKTDTVDGQEITYRAVVNAYIFSDNTVHCEILCIYPKKSNTNDFKSRSHNEIKLDEIASAGNTAIAAALIPGLNGFVTELVNFDAIDTAKTLLQDENDALCLRGLKLYLDEGQDISSLPEYILRKLKLLSRNMQSHSPQAFSNVYPILAPLASVSATASDDVSAFNAVCNRFHDALNRKNFSSSVFLNSPEIYAEFQLLTQLATKISSSSSVNMQIWIAINLFGLRAAASVTYPMLVPSLKIDIDTENIAINFFQKNNDKEFVNQDHESLIKTLLVLSNYSDQPQNPHKIFNGLSIFDYMASISTCAFTRAKQVFLSREGQFDALIILYGYWGHEYTTMPNVLQTSKSNKHWKMRCNGIQLLKQGVALVEANKPISRSMLLQFLCDQIPVDPDAFTLCKILELVIVSLSLKLDVNPVSDAEITNRMFVMVKKQIAMLKITLHVDATFENIADDILSKLKMNPEFGKNTILDSYQALLSTNKSTSSSSMQSSHTPKPTSTL